MGQEGIKREFGSIEEAFEALPQLEREHCVRVADYAEIIFLQACAADIYPEDVKVRVRLKSEQSSIVADAARYMNIGKALVPELYHQLGSDFAPEEVALYRKHTTDGAKLAESLLMQNLSNPTELNIIMEAIGSHHELWGGKGFPTGAAESEIPIIGRIVALADALDHVASQKHSEKPLEYALEQISKDSGTRYDPVLVTLVMDLKAKLKRAFTKYIHQSRSIPVTVPLVRRRASRPFSLWYRPIVETKRNKTKAFEAEMRFKGKETAGLSYTEVEHIVKREGLLFDLGVYFVTELCDTVKRMDACGIHAAYIALAPPNGWLSRRGLPKEIASVLEDTQTQAKRLCIEVTAGMWASRTKTMQENLQKIAAMGCPVMFSGFGINAISAGDLKENGATMLRLSRDTGPKLADKQTTEYLAGLASDGIVLLADGIEKKSHQATFGRNKIAFATGVLIGDWQNEDSIIECELALLDS
ncbi:MAG: EAL domain-containing protein [Clostridia bacterium]|nr:EAL domain-containing protein [Clostridia bacterium]NCC66570.1 EAL domain-containing protein [Clostridia bacterium]